MLKQEPEPLQGEISKNSGETASGAGLYYEDSLWTHEYLPGHLLPRVLFLWHYDDQFCGPDHTNIQAHHC